MAKGLALQMIAAMVLAFVGVAVLIAMFSSSFTGSWNTVYCSSYSKVLIILPHRGGDAPIPKGCKDDPNNVGQTLISTRDPDQLALQMAGFILDCWEKYEGYGESRQVCNGLSIQGLEGSVTESMINDKMRGQELCPNTIQNSLLESGTGTVCGAINQIIMPIESIDYGDFIVISFFNETIEVK